LMVSMKAIPRKELAVERKPGSRFGKFLTAAFVAELEISTGVTFRVKRGDKVEDFYETALAREANNGGPNPVFRPRSNLVDGRNMILRPQNDASPT
jgi:hypothetical protein